MLLVLLPFVIIATAGFIIWYLHTIQESIYDFDMSITCLEIIIVVASILGVLLGAGAVICVSGGHSSANVKRVNSRVIILAELKSTDPVIHNKGITDAITYNQTVKDGKAYLANPWTNWLTDRIWTDAEYIEVDVTEYEIIPESESVKND